MKTNFQMLRELLEEYEPETWGICTKEEATLITDTLHIKEMDLLQLRNLRDFVVAAMPDDDMSYMDKMSAITYIIDCEIIEKGGEV